MLTTGWSQDLSHPKRLNPFANWSFCTHQRWQHRRWRVLPPRMMRNRSNMATPLKPRAMQTQQKATQANMQKGGFQNSIHTGKGEQAELRLVRPNHVTLLDLSAKSLWQLLLQFLYRTLWALFRLAQGASNTGLRAFSKTKPCTRASSLSKTCTKSRIRNAARVATAPTCACPGKKKKTVPQNLMVHHDFPHTSQLKLPEIGFRPAQFCHGRGHTHHSWDHLGLEANSWMPNSLPRPAEGLDFFVTMGRWSGWGTSGCVGVYTYIYFFFIYLYYIIYIYYNIYIYILCLTKNCGLMGYN